MSSDKPDVRPGILQSLPGISLRDFFAAHALPMIMRGMISPFNREIAAREAYSIADAMLRVREPLPSDEERQARLAAFGQRSVSWYLEYGRCIWCGCTEKGKHDYDCEMKVFLEDFPLQQDAQPAESKAADKSAGEVLSEGAASPPNADLATVVLGSNFVGEFGDAPAKPEGPMTGAARGKDGVQ